MNVNSIYSTENGNLEQLAKLCDITYDLLTKMMNQAESVKSNSYSPYSKFQVGCTLLTSSDTLFNGTNVENVSYGATICAERSAIVSAISNGEKSIKLYVVTSNLEEFLTPCGACRQCIVEFGKAKIILMNVKKQCKFTSIDELLPLESVISHLKK